MKIDMGNYNSEKRSHFYKYTTPIKILKELDKIPEGFDNRVKYWDMTIFSFLHADCFYEAYEYDNKEYFEEIQKKYYNGNAGDIDNCFEYWWEENFLFCARYDGFVYKGTKNEIYSYLYKEISRIKNEYKQPYIFI